MTKRIFIPFFVLILSVNLSSQSSLYIHKDLLKAYNKGTRSYDGKPGENYWQNFTEYKIDVNINPSSKLVEGKAEITFFNNSPDTLNKIHIKLHQNMNKKGNRRNAQLPENAITDGVTLQRIIYNNISMSADPAAKQISYLGSNLVLNLAEPLAPQSKSKIDIDWSFVIPDDPNPRMGAYSDSSFFIAYWYPKVSVYDDINGWDLTSYNGEHEFYNDYGNYDVNISVPANFLVWGTGIVKNLNEILNEEYFNRYQQAMLSDEVINIIDEESYASGNIFINKNGYTVWKFIADNVPDFAFGLSSFYLWDAVSSDVEPGRRVMCHTAYNPSSEFFREAAHISKVTVEMLSNDLPGVPFPYPHITVFHGSEGMEFPMIVNDGDFNHRISNVYVTAHEIAHTYFPFYVGINETRHSWMEEGFAYFLPTEIQLVFEPFDHRIRSAAGYANFAGKDDDLPLMTPTMYLTGSTLQMLNYYKSSVAFEMLLNVLGEDVFKQSLKEFIYRWAGKHPTPYDFFFTFDDVTGRDLGWFWKPWFFERGYPDIGIKAVDQKNAISKIVIEKTGSKPIPVHLSVVTSAGKEIKLKESAAIWENDSYYTFEVNDEVAAVEISTYKIPDSNPANNKWVK